MSSRPRGAQSSPNQRPKKKTKKKTNRNRRCRLISRPSSPPKKQTNKQTNKQKTKRPSTIPSSRTRRIDGDLVGASIGCRRISVVVIGCRRSTESDAGERETPFRVADHRLRQRCRFARRRGNSVRPGTSSSFPDHIFSFSQWKQTKEEALERPVSIQDCRRRACFIQWLTSSNSVALDRFHRSR